MKKILDFSCVFISVFVLMTLIIFKTSYAADVPFDTIPSDSNYSHYFVVNDNGTYYTYLHNSTSLAFKDSQLSSSTLVLINNTGGNCLYSYYRYDSDTSTWISVGSNQSCLSNSSFFGFRNTYNYLDVVLYSDLDIADNLTYTKPSFFFQQKHFQAGHLLGNLIPLKILKPIVQTLVGLVPCVIGCLIGLIALRKALTFLKTRLQGA